MFKDYYAILDIDPHSSLDEIISAYKKQAFKWHPDRNPYIDTTQKMQDINEAKLILKDKQAREKYDLEYATFKSLYLVNVKVDEETERSERYRNYTYNDYEFQDDVLKRWMQNASKQSKEYLNEMIDEFRGSIKSGSNSIVSLFIYFLPFLAGYFVILLIRGC